MYIPNAGFCGTDSFDYTLMSANSSDTATVTIEVVCNPLEESSASSIVPEEVEDAEEPQEDTPDAATLKLEDDFAEGDMNEALAIPVLLNDVIQGCE